MSGGQKPPSEEGVAVEEEDATMRAARQEEPLGEEGAEVNRKPLGGGEGQRQGRGSRSNGLRKRTREHQKRAISG